MSERRTFKSACVLAGVASTLVLGAHARAQTVIVAPPQVVVAPPRVVIAPPAAYVATVQPYYYEGHPVYWYNERWSWRGPHGWVSYAAEPTPLHEWRMHHPPRRFYYERHERHERHEGREEHREHEHHEHGR